MAIVCGRDRQRTETMDLQEQGRRECLGRVVLLGGGDEGFVWR